MTIWIEFIDGNKKEINVDDVREGKQCLQYIILYGPYKGEYNVPFCQIKMYRIMR